MEEKDSADIRKDDLSKILEKLMETSQKKEGEKFKTDCR